ncbi:N-acetylmuramoyl-L-alanine amidase [Neorhizobium sp. NCHU2750]|uniref:N-acetylmuramoyl-L-alanine amidase n=1 Tax=Neorhizobium sp. NCHU2750 TaxID=1825976 RepID=UPI001FDED967
MKLDRVLTIVGAAGLRAIAQGPRIIERFALVVALLFVAFSSASFASQQPMLAFAARVAGDDARTRVVIDFESKPAFSVHYIGKPERIVVDLSATAFGFPAGDLAPRGLFKDIRYGTMGEDSARLVFTTSRPVKLVTAEVRQNEDRGFRLILDAEITSQPQFDAMLKTQDWGQSAAVPPQDIDPPVEDGVFVVAVDAGHGGIDAGASGATTKTPEKTVTLAFAKLLADKLNKIEGVKAFLTRDDDTYLSLSERVTVARQHHADLFISIHADTLPQKDIRGATVYTLSDKASDRMAENLAARENLSDQLAGYQVEDAKPEVADILLDLTRRETQAFSVALADNVVKSFDGQVGLINNPHRQANFQVLRAPDIPSALLEMGFLSNSDDEKLLLDENWRDKVASLLAEAVHRYHKRSVANGG